jgi:hypothetical protein
MLADANAPAVECSRRGTGSAGSHTSVTNPTTTTQSRCTSPK